MENRVLIIGAGTVGLLMAQNLKKLGIPYAVFEQDASIDARPRDWSFGVYWAQSPLKECLPEGVDEKFLAENAQVDNLTPSADLVLPQYNTETGELIKNIPTPYSMRLQRRKFLRILSQGIDIRYGKRLAEVKTGSTVVATFEDGTKEEGKLLIGCDGAHSRIRKFLLGPEQAAMRQLPLLCNAALTSLPKETALALRKVHPRSIGTIDPSGRCGWMSVHDCSDPDPGKWIFTMLVTWPEAADAESKLRETGVLNTSSRPDIVRDLKEKTAGFAEPFKSFFQAIPDDAPAWHNRLSDWPTEKWDNRDGTVTLTGDAAHPMTFHRGQGLNNAINDAYSMKRALQDHHLSDSDSFSEALKVYEEDVCERGRKAVLSSAENSIMLHDWKQITKSAVFKYGIEPSAEDAKLGVKES
ncbi:hypothetical protein D9758_006216 [Tetrapyrgos nigripes]|uniref:FAD-binding domain-containing protein n=1 Tax=Tetrapyrgos nigripes TaxID=182062 RepID=A0A8H5GAY5_9AGAR|nr:hypothetical protein D9758_006216 [Tetrapyrgos nigripes]